MSLPKVSVVIPNYNYGKYLKKTVESVFDQSYKNVEIIVVDDGSSDDSVEILKGFGNRITVVQQDNQGVSRARNAGVNHSAGEFVAFLDADDLWLPEKLALQIQKFFDDDKIGFVHCSMSYINTDDEIIGEERCGREGWLANEVLSLRPAIIGAGSTCVVKRNVFDEIGGFDPRQTTAADWDFGYRVASKYKIGFVDELLVLYRFHGSNMHSNIRAMENDVKIGLEKAFLNNDPALQTIRSACYGNFYYTLAGSYFHSGQYRASLSNAFKSLWYTPSVIGNFLALPRKRLKTFYSK